MAVTQQQRIERRKAMKNLLIITALVFGISAYLATAQEGSGNERGKETATESFTDAQQAQVRAILSKYDASKLTVVQAQAIHDAFRQAGFHRGATLNSAVKAAGFDPDKLRDLAPQPGQAGKSDQTRSTEADGKQNERNRPATRGEGQQGQYTLAQATSDRAQLSTIAFSGLAFLTGDFGAATFMPPGKVADFFGFQYMRDIDAAGKGHNPIFLTRVAGDVLYILNDKQRQIFADLAAEQAPQFEQLALKRMPLIEAFQRQKDGTIPKGSSGLNREAVISYIGDFYALDAQLAYRRAEVFGQVVASLTQEQRAAFAKMKFGDFNTWPEKDESEALKRSNPGTSRFFTVAYMTYASEFFSWYGGSIEADTYFCPERHGTYFGSFFMKDMPAMNKRNYDISTAVTGDSGENFLKLLTTEQRKTITVIPENQKKLLAETVEVRRAISQELRKFLTGSRADKAKVLELGRRYGALDGEMSWMYATAFSNVGQTLTSAQRAACVKLRNLDGYQSSPAYMYSNPLQKLPALPSSDFLFAAPGQSSSPAAASAVSSSQSLPESSAQSNQGSGGGQSNTTPAGGQGGTPPTEAIKACGGKSAGDACSFLDKGTTAQGTCDTKPGVLACAPDRKSDKANSVGNHDKPAATGGKQGSFVLSSPGTDGGILPTKYTCDGAGVSPPLSWTGAPEGTREFALMMTTLPVDGSTKWNWVLYGIPASTTGLAENSSGVGVLGVGSHGATMAYEPPCSKGPGQKTYTFTLYALSVALNLPGSANHVKGDALTKTISPITIGSASVNLSYSRSKSGSAQSTGQTGAKAR
jgi:phosphatidylethanolamine-binding protein (PEBP) family uncharacterized protein